MRSLRVTAKRVQWSASPGYHIGNSAGTPTAIFIRVDEPQDHGNSMMKLAAKGSRRNKFTFWRERRAGRCEAPRRRRCRTSSRSGNKADARPPPRPSGLRPAGPLALLLAPHIPPRVLLVARASPAGLGACSKVSILFRHRPYSVGFGAGGGSFRASTSDVKPTRLWL